MINTAKNDDLLIDRALILIVDDEASQRLLMRETLSRDNFDVIEAQNGIEAVNAFEANDVDLILMDILMPVMGGLEACSRIRSCSGGADLPIVLITGLEDHDSIVNAFDVDATDFITKPVNWQILSHRVRYLLKGHRNLAALRDSETRLSYAQKIAMLGNWEWDMITGRFIGSTQALEIYGFEGTEIEVDYNGLIGIAHPQDRSRLTDVLEHSISQKIPFSIDHRLISADGSTRIVHQEGEVIFSKNLEPVRIQGTIQDISKRREAEEKIMQLAFFDTLTGLPNRTNFRNLVHRKIDAAKQGNYKLAVLFLDLDGFKRVNDTLGHNAGDDLLKQIASLLNDCLRSNDCVERYPKNAISSSAVSRLGGDEFTILLGGGLSENQQIAGVAQRILDHLGQPMLVRNQEVFITGSLGIAVFPSDGRDYETLLKNADIAMYQAKEAGKNCYRFYSELSSKDTTEKLDLESRLLKACREEEFVLYFQPQISLNSNAVVGLEALIRWQHPDSGIVYPGNFMPVLEDSGLIISIGNWVLKVACEQMSKWLQAGYRDMRMSVNVSGHQFHHHDFFNSVQAALNQSGLPAEYLELEMTESIVMQQVDKTITDLNKLKQLGVRLSLDDFGVGYSSMNYLKRFPLDTLKIDRGFIKNIASNSIDNAIVKATIAMSKSLGLTTIAEGVENKAQLNMVQKLGCDYVQGYYYSMPMPVNEVKAFLQQYMPCEVV